MAEFDKLNFADIHMSLLADRNIFLYGQIDQEICLTTQKTLLYLDSVDQSDINIYISGPGGSIYDGFGLIDFMKTIKSPINTFCVGLAASMSALIFLTEISAICCQTQASCFISLLAVHRVRQATSN